MNHMGTRILFALLCSLFFLGQITLAQNADLKPSTSQPKTISTYDLLIITPKQYVRELRPLVVHKDSVGVKTKLVTLQQVYQQTFWQGRDNPEKIKYFIKDAIEAWGITYVMLVGDYTQMPIRYVYNADNNTFWTEPRFISELYYADIYDSNGSFSSWDTNNNGRFGEWFGATAADPNIDLYPDVYVGRLACENLQEVKTVVDKIDTYESTPSSAKSWFSTMVVIGSDTFNDTTSTNIYEGEAETTKSLSYMTNFTGVKIWGSNKDTGGLIPVPLDIVKTISKGAGFVAFSGHGSPERWNTYWPEAFNEKRARGLWYYNLPFLHNGEKLPVVVIGGCHNSEYNVTATGFLHGAPWVYSPVPECFSWLFVRNPRGGAIATFGNTGLGYGAVGNVSDLDGDGINDPDCCEALGGYLEGQFFKAYGVEGVHVLGEAWGAAITQYLNTYPGMHDIYDCKTVQEWAMLGDPSLMIGGY